MTDISNPSLNPASAGAGSSWAAMERVLDQQAHATDGADGSGLLYDQDLGLHEPFEALAESGTLPVGMFAFLRQAGDRLARIIAQTLRQRSGALVDVAMVDHVNLRFGAALATIPIPSLMSLLRAEPSKSEILVVIDGAMAALYFDLLLGGAQIRPSAYQPVRNFSAIETRLFRILSDKLGEGLANSFQEWLPTTMVTDRIETNPRYLAFAKAQDSLVKMRFIVELGLRSGFIDFFIPARFLAPIEQKLRPKSAQGEERDDPQFARHLKRELMKSKLDLVARLSELRLPLSTLQRLKPGDVIPLHKTSDSLIDLMIDRKIFAQGKMGRSTGKIAVRVEQIPNQKPNSEFPS